MQAWQHLSFKPMHETVALHKRVHARPVAGDTAPRVVVLGGGFGGLYAAVRLDQLMWPRGTKPQASKEHAEHWHARAVSKT